MNGVVQEAIRQANSLPLYAEPSMTPTRVRRCNTAETGNIEGDSLAGQTPREGLPRTAGMPSLYLRVGMAKSTEYTRTA